MEKRLQEIGKRVEEIKSELATIGPMRPGAITQQSRGGKAKFNQLSYTHRMKGHTEYVGKRFVAEVQAQLDEYRRFKSLCDEWVELGIEGSRLKMKMDKERVGEEA